MDKIIAEAYRMYFKDEITFIQLVGIINKTYYGYGQKHIFLVTPTSELQLLTNLFKSFLRKVEK
jgi:hypothetical protein